MTGAELRETRQALGLTQQTLADELGLSRRMIIAMERGEKPIERRTARAVRCLLLDSGAETPAYLQHATE